MPSASVMEREEEGEVYRGTVHQATQQHRQVGREASSSSFGSGGRRGLGGGGLEQRQPRRPSNPSSRYSSGSMTAPHNGVPVSPRMSPRPSASPTPMAYHPGDFPELPRSNAAPANSSNVVPPSNPTGHPHRSSPAPRKAALKSSISNNNSRRSQQTQQPSQETAQQSPTLTTPESRGLSSPQGSMRGNVFQASNRSSDPAFPYQGSGGGFDSGRGTAVTGNSSTWLQSLKFGASSYQRSRSSGNTMDEDEEAEEDDEFDEHAGFGFGANARQLAPQSSYRPSSFSRQLLQRPSLQEQLQGTTPADGRRAARRSSKDQDAVSDGNSTITSMEDDLEGGAGADGSGSGGAPHHPFHHPYGQSPYPEPNRDEVESIGKTTITTVSEVEIRPHYGDSFSTSDGGADGSSNKGSNTNSNSSFRRQRRLEEILQGKKKNTAANDDEKKREGNRRGSGGLFSAPSQDDDDDGRMTYNQTLPDTDAFRGERRPSEIVEEDFADQRTEVDESIDPTARPEDMQPAPMIMQAPPPTASSGASVGTDPVTATPTPIDVETPTLVISPQEEGYSRPEDIYNSYGGGAITNIVVFRSSAATAAIMDNGGGKGAGGYGGGDYERRPSAGAGSHHSNIFTYSCRVDRSQDDKAMEIPLNSFARPHMRAFHLAWISFFVAFFAWFAVTPLLGEIKKSLDFTKREIWTSNIAAVAGSALFRVLVGPLCDKYGARWVMGCTLLISAVPVVTTGLIQTAQGLATVRLFVGIAGSSFVTTEYWTSTMFTREVAGTANALVAGWGNLGGGVTQLVMGSVLFPSFRYFYRKAASDPMDDDDTALNDDDVLFGLDGVESENTTEGEEEEFDIASERAWRTIFVIPAIMCILVAHMVIRHADDCPKGNYDSLRQMGQLVEISPSVAFKTALRNPNVWILFVQYGTCFGVELTMSNAAALYFSEEYGQPTESAAAIASIFGWLNLFARGLGGFWGDMANARSGMRGRLWWQTILFALEGLSVMAFSQTRSLASTIVVMTIFSLFVQACEGSTYGIVPYIDPAITGSVAGIVAAGGNVGGTALGLIFREVDYRTAFFWTGVAILCSSVLSAFISIDGHNRMFSCCEPSDGSSSRGRMPSTQQESLAHQTDAGVGGDILGGSYVGSSIPDGAILGGGYVGTGSPVVGGSYVASATPNGEIEVATGPKNYDVGGEADASSVPSIPHAQTAPPGSNYNHPSAPATAAPSTHQSPEPKQAPGRTMSENGLSV